MKTESYEERQERERMEWAASELQECAGCHADSFVILGNFGLCPECHENKLNSPAYKR